jgi:hypothetical protein
MRSQHEILDIEGALRDLRRCRRVADENLGVLLRGVDRTKLSGPDLAGYEHQVSRYSRVLSIVTPQVLDRADLEELSGVCLALQAVLEESPIGVD